MKFQFVFWLFFTTFLQAQDKKDTLKQVEIITNKYEEKVKKEIFHSYKIEKDSLGFLDITKQLQSTAPLHFQSGGLNDYASISIRGASIAQTKMTWNGIPFNSALSGIGDISTLSGAGITDITVFSGGSGAWLGSQAIGGAILFNSQLSHQNECQLSLNYASFDRKNILASIETFKNSWSVKLLWAKEEDENDYPFPYKKNIPWYLPKNENGQWKSDSWFGSIQKENKHFISKIDAWYFKRNRGISPLINDFNQHANIEDEALRLAWNTALQSQKVNGDFVLGFTNEKMRYMNLYYKLDNANDFSQWNFIAKNIKFNSKYLKNFTFQASHQISHSNFNTASQKISNIGFHFQKKINDNFRFVFSDLWFLYQNKWSSTPSISLIKYAQSHWIWNASLQKVYRIPTYNDLYFIPGGNPDLKAEKGWSVQIGNEFQKENVHFQSSIFARNIQDWIVWYGSMIWSPHNVAQVVSRGLELSYSQSKTGKKSSLFWSFNTMFVKTSTEKVSSSIYDKTLGKMIAYVPKLTIRSQVKYQWKKKFGIIFTQIFQSNKFATMDESIDIPAFYTADFDFFYVKNLKNQSMKMEFGIKNVTNTYYQHILNRPMPGRYFELKINFRFRK